MDSHNKVLKRNNILYRLSFGSDIPVRYMSCVVWYKLVNKRSAVRVNLSEGGGGNDITIGTRLRSSST